MLTNPGRQAGKSIASTVANPGADSVDYREVPTPRDRSRVGTVSLPGTEEVWESHYQAPDPGQISIPNPGLRTRPGLRYHQIHGRSLREDAMTGWGDNSGQSVSFSGRHQKHPDGPVAGAHNPGRVTIARRQPITQLAEQS